MSAELYMAYFNLISFNPTLLHICEHTPFDLFW